MAVDRLLGVGIGLFMFLWVAGYNVLPIGLLAVLGFFVWKFLLQRQMGAGAGRGVKVEGSLIGFEDIGGQATAKKELQEALDFLLHSESMKKLGIRPLKGILLSGPPGTGKTLLAKAAARYTDSVFLSISGSEFVEMYAGVGAERVRGLFRRARELSKKEKKSRAIIFIDEMDILGAKRGGHVSHHEYDQTLNQLLVEMDGMGTNQETQILVVAATNRAEALDPALLRPGRFDRLVKVDLPDKVGRLAILQIHTRNKPCAEDVDLESLARETYTFSGAHLESVANEAAVFALRDDLQEIHMRHFQEAIEKVLMGEKLERKPSREELQRVAIHEGGHALLAESVRPNSVAQISIRSRGNALGYVRHYPEDDLYLYTQEMIEQQIMVALAGAVAEEEVLGARSTGAAGDYEQALNLVDRLLASGMSSLGVVDVAKLGQEQRQAATREILGDLERRTKETIIAKRKSLLDLAEVLSSEEVLNGEALRSLLEEVAA